MYFQVFLHAFSYFQKVNFVNLSFASLKIYICLEFYQLLLLHIFFVSGCPENAAPGLGPYIPHIGAGRTLSLPHQETPSTSYYSSRQQGLQIRDAFYNSTEEKSLIYLSCFLGHQTTQGFLHQQEVTQFTKVQASCYLLDKSLDKMGSVNSTPQQALTP